jgi:hypothetical protein
MIGCHVDNHDRTRRRVEVDDCRPGRLCRGRLGEDASLRPGPEGENGERNREEQEPNRQTELHGSVTTIVHGGNSRVAWAVISTGKPEENGVQPTNTARPVAVMTEPPTSQVTVTPSPIRPPSS